MTDRWKMWGLRYRKYRVRHISWCGLTSNAQTSSRARAIRLRVRSTNAGLGKKLHSPSCRIGLVFWWIRHSRCQEKHNRRKTRHTSCHVQKPPQANIACVMKKDVCSSSRIRLKKSWLRLLEITDPSPKWQNRQFFWRIRQNCAHFLLESLCFLSLTRL